MKTVDLYSAATRICSAHFETNRENIQVAAVLLWEKTPPCCQGRLSRPAPVDWKGIVTQITTCFCLSSTGPHMASSLMILTLLWSIWTPVSESGVKSCFWLHPTFSRHRLDPAATAPEDSFDTSDLQSVVADHASSLRHRSTPSVCWCLLKPTSSWIMSLSSIIPHCLLEHDGEFTGLQRPRSHQASKSVGQRGDCHREFEITWSETEAHPGRHFRPQAEITLRILPGSKQWLTFAL